MDIESIINNIAILPQQSLEELIAITETVKFPKGYLISQAGKTEHFTYFISMGLVRAFQYKDGDEVTFWFGKEGDTVLSMRSYIEDKPSYENIESLEELTAYKLNNSDLRKLYEKDIHIANWGRKLAERELLRTEENFISRQFKTATERYEELIKTHPHLLQRVQLGYIASYLGITQVSLSRIRASI
ncbi:Crp/Fnr family transcriptional regulator [Paludibacter sp. 221]|uniref:Crp/Fnr family transcriptional regulator n=1 Tax=Paludibacter sp. 221 TaxID=2302939 RepID=UPI0013D283BD|nr:Crp/Fnr family transcriptional regulator [Paludibacter sp. 221]NDV47248.1 Crp/Fnr family transcriptional regulator [Paludibacter sp. 221]